MLTSEWYARLRSKSSGESFFATATCTSSRRTPSIGTNNNERLGDLTRALSLENFLANRPVNSRVPSSSSTKQPANIFLKKSLHVN